MRTRNLETETNHIEIPGSHLAVPPGMTRQMSSRPPL
jgi:hypothetical protein